jgi:hypothetical protein
VSPHRRAAVGLIAAGALMLAACGGEDEPATTAQTQDAQPIAEAGSDVSGSGKPKERDGDGDEQRPDRDRGDDRETGRHTDRDGDGNQSSGGGDRKPDDGDRARSGGSPAQQELESNVQELLEGSDDDEPPDKGDSDLQVPPGLSDGGGQGADPLEQACEELGGCSGSGNGG